MIQVELADDSRIDFAKVRVYKARVFHEKSKTSAVVLFELTRRIRCPNRLLNYVGRMQNSRGTVTLGLVVIDELRSIAQNVIAEANDNDD